MIILEPLLDSMEFIEMSDERYFSKEYSDCISNSRLSLINPEQGGSPEKYLANVHKTSPSLALGSAVHELVLQPNDFILAPNLQKPTAKLGEMADRLYDTCIKKFKEISDEALVEASERIDYYRGKIESKHRFIVDSCNHYWVNRLEYERTTHLKKEPIYLDATSLNKCKLCNASVISNSEIQNLLHPQGILEKPLSMNEAALFINIKATDTESGKDTILKFKAKLDNFTIDLEAGTVVLNDLKTTAHYLDDFGLSYEKYHYYRQMAAYLWLCWLYAEKYHGLKEIISSSANMLLVSTIPNHRSGVYKVSLNDIQRGWDEFIKLLKMVANLEINGCI